MSDIYRSVRNQRPNGRSLIKRESNLYQADYDMIAHLRSPVRAHAIVWLSQSEKLQSKCRSGLVFVEREGAWRTGHDEYISHRSASDASVRLL